MGSSSQSLQMGGGRRNGKSGKVRGDGAGVRDEG